MIKFSIGQDREKGTALITAILLVTLMATLAVALVDVSRFGIFRTANVNARDQAYWYALGARDYAESLLGEGIGQTDFLPSDTPWLDTPQTFPIEGGVIVIRVADFNNCFNPNTLFQSVGAGEMRLNIREFNKLQTLLNALNLDPTESEAFVSQLLDWMDPDGFTRAMGAEDDVYSGLPTPYLTANQRLIEAENVLALRMMTPEFYHQLEPWICPQSRVLGHALNINTLRLDQVPLLYAWFEGDLSYSDAEALLFRRPSLGYEDVDAFWEDPSLQALEIDPALRNHITLSTKIFEVEVSVALNESQFHLREVVEVSGPNQLRRLSQRFGAFE